MPQDKKKKLQGEEARKKLQANHLIQQSRIKKTAAASYERLAEGQRKIANKGYYLRTDGPPGEALAKKAKLIRFAAEQDSIKAERLYPGIGRKKKK